MKSIALLGSLLLTLSAFAAENSQQEWRFQVLLDDDPIGFHAFTLSSDGQERVIDSRADFAVNFLFINAYSYEHQATERWAGDCLRRIESTTDDNGTHFTVDGTLEQESFVVKTAQERKQMPACIMSFAYWNPAILDQERLLNAQTGAYVDVAVSFTGQESFALGNQQITADRYLLETEGKRISLWYSAEDRRWLGLESMTKDGYRLRYQPVMAQLPGARLSQR
ncbi:MAG: DUF6134 family protein [Candidatus Competibacteraceae bacterium]|jgi:hypothetical protein|nr:DUF6134 family protein [Candidatus Competibacteraceae bacterium]